MSYAAVQDNKVVEFPLTIDEIKLRFPNTSFTSPFTPPDGYVFVQEVAKPETTHEEIAVEGAPVFSNGTWYTSWVIEQADAAVVLQRTEEEAKKVRKERNEAIESCDWTQLPDTQVDANTWAVYRQQLRDLPEQSGFPWEITWPEEPA